MYKNEVSPSVCFLVCKEKYTNLCIENCRIKISRVGFLRQSVILRIFRGVYFKATFHKQSSGEKLFENL